MNQVFIGKQQLKTARRNVEGSFLNIDGSKYYEIRNFDNMPPFFISIASNSDHWMFLSSNGGITAGRKNADLSLFPYYTDDKITDFAPVTGSTTFVRLHTENGIMLWEPFSEQYAGIYDIERSIAKNTNGTSIIFREVNHDLKLTFEYRWMNSDRFGWVRKCKLINNSSSTVSSEILDGLINLLPAGIDRNTQNTYSTLVDAYKKTELLEDAALAIFRMESILVDRAEPSESLRANTVWMNGLNNAAFLLSTLQIENFRRGDDIETETASKGVKGAFLANAKLQLGAGDHTTWHFVAEVNLDAARINNLRNWLQNSKNTTAELEADIAKGQKQLMAIVGKLDGLQQTADPYGDARHYSNVLFNAMRGGIYADGYTINTKHFAEHLYHFNPKVAQKHQAFINSLSGLLLTQELEQSVQKQEDPQLTRLFLEYLPLTFSRRHGDPSRPWNQFNIQLKDENGGQLLSYQGNWRDIFQNWEALSLSYPLYCRNIIAKFLNATTADGYNPYKITHKGIEWETIEPDNPWSNIGYWGDHQIIYLLKLLELAHQHNPNALPEWFNSDIFAFANVPYRIKSYDEIVVNPKDSIRFDAKLHHSIEQLTTTLGADAKLLMSRQGDVILVNMTEKLLATFLSKMSNFIPGAGIWMNTLRPEWNDANNALVGYGASMVTVYYLRRFTAFLIELYHARELQSISLTAEMASFFLNIKEVLQSYVPVVKNGFDDHSRRGVTDLLGRAGNSYRDSVYHGHSGKRENIEVRELIQLLKLCQEYIDNTIAENKREDGLYHAYNLVKFSGNTIRIRRLYEMLEGQVAILSSGILSPAHTVTLLDALRNSKLYRADQESYMLYPDKQLATFLEKNCISAEAINNIPLLKEMVAKGDKSLVTADEMGEYHFNADFNNADFLQKRIESLKSTSEWDISEETNTAILELYEQVFDHQSFTGRSGTFYKYEGLGSIYWHMVSKLLLAVGESLLLATKNNDAAADQLKEHYREIKKGIGAHKTPEAYGAFPFDPYSHTPRMSGVQQPGMTGQVKEDVLNRFAELGVKVENGCISFQPMIIESQEWIQPEADTESKIPYLEFTYCGTAITYMADQNTGIELIKEGGSIEKFSNNALNTTISEQLFSREHNIKKIIIHI